MDWTELLTSWVFWMFGGGITLSLVAVLSEAVVKSRRIHAQERKEIREEQAAAERFLLGVDGGETDDMRGVKLRLEALEHEVDHLKRRLTQATGPAGHAPQEQLPRTATGLDPGPSAQGQAEQSVERA